MTELPDSFALGTRGFSICSDKAVGKKVMPFRIEDELMRRGANCIEDGLFKAFVVRDGHMVCQGVDEV